MTQEASEQELSDEELQEALEAFDAEDMTSGNAYATTGVNVSFRQLLGLSHEDIIQALRDRLEKSQARVEEAEDIIRGCKQMYDTATGYDDLEKMQLEVTEYAERYFKLLKEAEDE